MGQKIPYSWFFFCFLLVWGEFFSSDENFETSKWICWRQTFEKLWARILWGEGFIASLLWVVFTFLTRKLPLWSLMDKYGRQTVRWSPFFSGYALKNFTVGGDATLSVFLVVSKGCVMDFLKDASPPTVKVFQCVSGKNRTSADWQRSRLLRQTELGFYGPGR